MIWYYHGSNRVYMSRQEVWYTCMLCTCMYLMEKERSCRSAHMHGMRIVEKLRGFIVHEGDMVNRISATSTCVSSLVSNAMIQLFENVNLVEFECVSWIWMFWACSKTIDRIMVRTDKNSPSCASRWSPQRYGFESLMVQCLIDPYVRPLHAFICGPSKDRIGWPQKYLEDFLILSVRIGTDFQCDVMSVMWMVLQQCNYNHHALLPLSARP